MKKLLLSGLLAIGLSGCATLNNTGPIDVCHEAKNNVERLNKNFNDKNNANGVTSKLEFKSCSKVPDSTVYHYHYSVSIFKQGLFISEMAFLDVIRVRGSSIEVLNSSPIFTFAPNGEVDPTMLKMFLAQMSASTASTEL